jgi:hypothetical protein
MIRANETNSERTLIQFGIRMIACLVALAVLALLPSSISAQQNRNLTGDYAGTLGPLHIKLHLKVNASGRVTGTLDSPDRGVIGIQCTGFHVDGQSVTFDVPAVQAMWKGTIAMDGTLTGTWDQGHSLPLNFSRDAAAQGGKDLKASLR